MFWRRTWLTAAKVIECFSDRIVLFEHCHIMSNISHVSVGVNDLAQARGFYDP